MRDHQRLEQVLKHALNVGRRTGLLRMARFTPSVIVRALFRPVPISNPLCYEMIGTQRYGLKLMRRGLWRAIEASGRRTPYVVDWVDGLRLYLYPGSEMCRTLFIHGAYELESCRLLRNALKPGSVFLDVGANMGLYTLLAAKWVGDSGKVYAFEPATQARARLERNVVLNQLRNVTIVPIALTEKASMSKLLVATDERDGHHTLGSFYDAEAVLNHVEDIRTEKLDDWFQMYNPWRVDVIKIDVEGAEMKMILGAQEVIQRFRPLLLMEISDATLTRQGSSRREVVECLREMRYTVRFLYKGRLLNPGEAPAEAIQGVAEPIMAN